MRRKVARSTRDPTDPKRTLYMLDCGHSVSRRTNGEKLWCDCAECDRQREAWERIKARVGSPPVV